MYCWSDLNGRLRRHRRASPSTVKNIRIENIEKYKEKDKRHHENNKNKIQEKKTKHYKKNSKHREGNREALRQTQRKRYQREKDKINAKRRDRQKQKKEQQLAINQKQFMPIIRFTHSI